MTPVVAAVGASGPEDSNKGANRLLAEGAQQQEGFPISNRGDAAIDARTSPLPLPNTSVPVRGALEGTGASFPPSDGEGLSTTPPSSSEGGVIVVEGSGAVEKPEQEEGEGKDYAGVGKPEHAEGAVSVSGAKHEDAGFGEHGWYSTSSMTEDDIG